ncbi:rod shape-determining protein [Patescibacteria group bacterium]|nr:rod shape-determining protein [Patescibacteria group bacterium]
MILRQQLSIDLGTSNIRLGIPKKGILINEPAVVALDRSNYKIMAIGEEARDMLGKTPSDIIAAKPLKNGVIANYRITEAITKYYTDKVLHNIRLLGPEIMSSVPAGITSTERRAIIDAIKSVGTNNVYIIKAPLAAALGAGIAIAEPHGNMILDIGAGTSEIAVISLGNIVSNSSIRVAGDSMDHAIIDYIRKKYNLSVGEKTAEKIKIEIGAISPQIDNKSIEISGNNTISELPEIISITTEDTTDALKNPVKEIIHAVKQVLQHTPPELASDVIDRGIILTGSGAKLRGLDELLSRVTGVPVHMAEDPEFCVIKGCNIALENIESYKRSAIKA